MAVCKECLKCWNYMVSEVGCYGSSMPCGCYITDADEDEEVPYEYYDEYVDEFDDRFHE